MFMECINGGSASSHAVSKRISTASKKFHLAQVHSELCYDQLPLQGIYQVTRESRATNS